MKASNIIQATDLPMRRAALFGLLLSSVCLLACQFTTPPPVALRGGSPSAPQAIITAPGVSALDLPLPTGQPPWSGFSLVAAGDRQVRHINLAGLPGRNLLQPPFGVNPADAFPPFNLLPRESFALTGSGSSLTASGISPGTLSGLFLWELPSNRDAFRAALLRLDNLDWHTTHGLTINMSGHVSLFELACDAPLPHVRASVAWQASAPALFPEIWLSLNGTGWARLPASRASDPWEEPYDLTRFITGQRHFLLRFIFIPTSADMSPYFLRRFRIEREVAGPGGLTRFHPGSNPLNIATGENSGPLQLQMIP